MSLLRDLSISALVRTLLLVALAIPFHARAAGDVHPASLAAEVDPTLADGVQEAQVHCLALNIYHEARSEPVVGKLAIAFVTMNRVDSGQFPDSVCRVVWQRKQFSWTHDGRTDKPYERQAWHDALALARDVYDRDYFNPVSDATHYHAAYVSPYWASEMHPVARVGRHLFYRQSRRLRGTS